MEIQKYEITREWLKKYKPGRDYRTFCEDIKNEILKSIKNAEIRQDEATMRKWKNNLSAVEKFESLLQENPRLREYSGEKIMTLYGDIIFRNGTQYDVSQLIDPSLIIEEDGEKCIYYKELTKKPEEEVKISSASEQRSVTISRNGVFEYYKSYGQPGELFRYEIIKEDRSGLKRKNNVLSNINIQKIRDENESKDKKYTKAVLELLSDNNIKLSNAGEYIGVLKETREEDRHPKEGNISSKVAVNSLVEGTGYTICKSAYEATASFLQYIKEKEQELDRSKKNDNGYEGIDIPWNFGDR